MEVTAQDRQQLFAWFEEHMGKERAATMMELLPPEGGSSLATQANVEAQGTVLRHALEAQGAAFKRDLDGQIADVRRDLEALEQRMDLKLERLQSNLLRTGGTWLFASQAAVITAVGVFTALG